MDVDEKVRENRLRRVAQRRGWRVLRVPGAYLVLDAGYRAIIGQAGDLDGLEDLLSEPRGRQPQPAEPEKASDSARIIPADPNALRRYQQAQRDKILRRVTRPTG